ncbi:type VI secretion system baseplate subunit TssE [Psychrobacter halodurans]|uniref:Type VI secretion system baseplate subunit TssE n=1 Tax=Psychrobacter halodurans TaxID=2818439 RepID=A0AAW4IRP0_9GAMM|nr:type VI secretion system baseplate subunit TssE [Psychrobacter halodurans]MBO1517930.1 type VI secretion system baseplate subunit TssE [Psychrobacter halodurans]
MSYSDTKSGFRLNLFEQLFDDQPRYHEQQMVVRRLNINELKASVAKDLEALLNTRCVMSDRLQEYPTASASVLNFGILDFVGLSSANPADCDYICRQIAKTIEQQDLRLRNVRVSLDIGAVDVNQLCFSIEALLKVYPARELVSFDAFFEPSFQRYYVK